MQELLRVIVLGIVQGLTEFLPISSSGHLIVVRELFGWEFDDDLTLDVALHVGTTAAVLAFFWREWLSMLRAGLGWAGAPGGRPPAPGSAYDERLLLLLAIGSLPAGIVGLAFESTIEDHVRSPVVAGAMLLAFAGLLLIADAAGRHKREIASSSWRDALLVGCAQAVALIPGVSRSGITISTSLARDYTRLDAARLSFLLATPVIVGAGMLQTARAATEGIPADEIGTMLAGATVAALAGWLSIRYLLRLLQFGSYLPFVAYRVLAGVFVVAYFAF
jgi:undecaprenyl-diphosphatase